MTRGGDLHSGDVSNQTPWRLVSTGVRLAIALALVGLLAYSDGDTDSDGAGAATTSVEREPVEQPGAATTSVEREPVEQPEDAAPDREASFCRLYAEVDANRKVDDYDRAAVLALVEVLPPDLRDEGALWFFPIGGSTEGLDTSGESAQAAGERLAVAFKERCELKADFMSRFEQPTTGITSCPVIAIHFQDRTTGRPTAWEWTFGDGSTSSEQNPTWETNAVAAEVTLTASRGDVEDSVTKVVSTPEC